MAQLTPEQRRLAATGKISQIKPPEGATPQPPATPAAEPVKPTEQPASTATPEPGKGEAKPATEPKTETPADPEATATPAPTDDSPESGDQAGDKDSVKRFRFSSEEDKTIAALAKSKGISLREAARLYEGSPNGGSQEQRTDTPTAKQEPAASAPEADANVEAYEQQITEAQAEIDRLVAERDAASEDLDSKKANALSDQIADKKAELRLLNHEKSGYLKQQQAERQNAQRKNINESRDRAYVKFPVLADEGSLERQALENYTNRALNDPSRAKLFKNPNWPEVIAEEFAAKHGIKAATEAKAQPAAAATPQPAALPKPAPKQVPATPAGGGAKLLTGADGQTKPSATRPLTRERVSELIRNDPEARRAIVKQIHSNR